jgi:hypothetical protein
MEEKFKFLTNQRPQKTCTFTYLTVIYSYIYIPAISRVGWIYKKGRGSGSKKKILQKYIQWNGRNLSIVAKFKLYKNNLVVLEFT